MHSLVVDNAKLLYICSRIIWLIKNTNIYKMRRNLLTVALLALSLSVTAQVICHVDAGGLFYVSENTLVYNGGGVQTKDNGIYDIHGNVMVVGSGSSDVLKTLTSTGADKLTGGNIILRLNTPASAATSTYGQLYINGIAQGNLTAVVDKEFRTPKHGTTNYFQQIALPFYNKTLSTLSTEFAKTFGTTRWTQNEILKHDGRYAVSRHYTNLSTQITDPTGYYMLGSKNNNLDTSTPPAGMVANAPTPLGSVYTLRGVPYAAGISTILKDAGKDVPFGTGGNGINEYNERYNTYIQDKWDFSTGAWINNYGRNIYQYGNPFFTNLDLSKIGYVEAAAIGDNNQLLTIQGIQYDPGVVTTLPNGSTYFTGAQIQNFVLTGNNQGTPVADVGLIIKPMQSFIVKLTAGAASDAQRTLNFDTLRRFKSTVRAAGDDYSVTAKRGNGTGSTVKQLGVIALDANGKEMARTYYVVYPEAISGHPGVATTQSTNSSNNLIGTFEEDAVNGGYDQNYTSSYWLYVNEANEIDFKGKAVPMNLYNSEIKSLKFEVRENAELINNDEHLLSTGIGFYYKSPTGSISEVKQNQIIPVNSDQYSLYYGKADLVLGTGDSNKPSRTMVVYNGSIDKFVVRFDPDWKKSDINVYDMSGKLVISQKDVLADKDFEINLAKINSGYIVTAVSEKGEKISTKIIR